MESPISKLKVAQSHLDWAIQLYLDFNAYIPAATLAGVAQDILGHQLEHPAHESALKALFKTDYADLPRHELQAALDRTKDLLNKWNESLHEEMVIDADAVSHFIARGLTSLVAHGVELSHHGSRFIQYLMHHKPHLL